MHSTWVGTAPVSRSGADADVSCFRHRDKHFDKPLKLERAFARAKTGAVFLIWDTTRMCACRESTLEWVRFLASTLRISDAPRNTASSSSSILRTLFIPNSPFFYHPSSFAPFLSPRLSRSLRDRSSFKRRRRRRRRLRSPSFSLFSPRGLSMSDRASRSPPSPSPPPPPPPRRRRRGRRGANAR